MKIRFHNVLLGLTLFSSSVFSQKKEVTVRISQDDKFVVLEKYENHISLKRKSFKIQILLSNVEGIYSFAGFTDSLCCRMTEIDSIPRFALLPDISMAEPEFNKEKELLVGDDDCSYWYYDKNLASHRFNKKVILLDSNRYVGIKTVKQVFDVRSQKEIKLKDLRYPLYILFVAVDEFDTAGKPKKELMRRKVKIDWLDED